LAAPLQLPVHLNIQMALLGSLPRSADAEILDSNEVAEEERVRAYRQLHRTHQWLGNTAAILKLLRHDPLPVRRVLDIGCGHGLLLQQIRRDTGAEVVGFDLHPAAPGAPVSIVSGNAVSDPLPRADVALAVCMAHHLSEDEVVGMIRNVSRSCRRFILLDLVRHPLPLLLFRTFVCPLLDPINAQDGVTSLQRAYTPQELRRIAERALEGSGGKLRHSVSPLYIRQVVDFSW
jgi:SAM-dependent methyltransferase